MNPISGIGKILKRWIGSFQSQCQFRKEDRTTNVLLILAGTNNILASFTADYVPPVKSIIKIEDPDCSAAKLGFSYKKYRVLTEPRVSIMRYSIDTGRNASFYQRLFVEIEPVDSEKE